jgi:hypothetical protein
MTPMPAAVVLHAAAHLIESGQLEFGDIERGRVHEPLRELLTTVQR